MVVDILAFGAHPDDVELACGGTLLAHAARGYTFGICDLTRGELGTRGSAELRDREATASAEIMGASFRQNLHMADGGFANDGEHQRKIIEVIRWSRPKLVLANALSDRHPDHGRAAKLVADACFFAGLRRIKTSYDGEEQEAYRPIQLLHFIQDFHRTPDFVTDVTAYYGRKLQCIKAFGSQFHDPDSDEPQTPLSGQEFFAFLEARCREFGRPAGYEFAEGFERSRLFGVPDLLALD